jgi:hypothetical protein
MGLSSAEPLRPDPLALVSDEIFGALIEGSGSHMTCWRRKRDANPRVPDRETTLPLPKTTFASVRPGAEPVACTLATLSAVPSTEIGGKDHEAAIIVPGAMGR